VIDVATLAFDTPDALATLERGDRTYEARTSPVEGRDGRVIGHTIVLTDVTGREERERRLRDQRDELRRLEALNDAVRGVNRALVEAATVEDIETAVAEQVSDAGLYAHVRVVLTPPQAVEGETDVGPRVVDGDGVAEWLVGRTADGEPGTGAGTGDRPPADGGIETPPNGRWAVAPVTFGRTTYGVLAVNSAREEDVSERELAVLDELGSWSATASTRSGAVDCSPPTTASSSSSSVTRTTPSGHWPRRPP